MTVQLRSDDFKRLRDILANLPNFRSEAGRIRLISGALIGSDRASDILNLINFSGDARGVAFSVIQEICNFGRVTAGKEALAILLNDILSYKGDADDDAEFMRGLLESYSLDKPIVSNLVIDEWRGDDNPVSVQEKIIGENTLRDIRVLRLALQAAEAVVRIEVPGGYGTGFMVSSNLVMTNNHVIGDKKTAAASVFTFNYELDLGNMLRDTIAVSAFKDGHFHTNAELDYTVIHLENAPKHIKPVTLRPINVAKDERVTIIQHPGGHVKKISIQNNFVVYADQCVIQYTTSTMPGSSGSPVFNDDFIPAAIHHSGGMLTEPGNHRRYLRNEGTSTTAILNDLKVAAPKIYDLLAK